MAGSMTIHFEVEPETGERTIVVRYQSDPDALPMEHEEEHRQLVEKLLSGGLIEAAEAGRVIIEREGIEDVREAESTSSEQERKQHAVEQES